MRLLLVALAVLFTAGCAFSTAGLDVGMTAPEVLDELGAPDGRVVEGEWEGMRWANRLVSNTSPDRADYWVLLQGGRVVSYGPGEVRPGGGNVSTLVFIPLR